MPSVTNQTDSLRAVIFTLLCFGLFFSFVGYQHKVYLSNYIDRQIAEEKETKQKIITTIKELRDLATIIGKVISAYPNDYQKIQTVLAGGAMAAKEFSIPSVEHITYCSVSGPKKTIISSTNFPISCNNCCSVLHKSLNELDSLTAQDNYLIGTIPVFDKQEHLLGVLQMSIPFIDMQKFIGVEKMTTLEFPKIFDEDGKRVIQKDLFNFSRKAPLAFCNYLSFYRSEFFFVSLLVVLGMFFLIYPAKVVQLTSDASIEAYSSFQRLLIQRFKMMTTAIYKSIEYVGHSYNDSESLGYLEKLNLLDATKQLAQDLSYGACMSLNKELINMKEALAQVQLHFNDQIQKHNVRLHVKCSQDLVFIGDPLFIRIILLNVIGQPLCSMPNKGKLSIKAKQENGFVYLKILDNRYRLSNSAQSYLKNLFEFFIEEPILRQICLKNGLGYELAEKEKGKFYTKVCLPVNSDQLDKANIVNFM